MRIISGKMKGSKLFLPKNKSVRPLKDLARESIFNFLTHSNKISFELENSNVLDLYAGSGSFGLECLSRQANSVYFIEKDINTIEILKKNVQKLKLINETVVLIDDVFNVIKKKLAHKIKFDLIFCDPPFKDKNIGNLIEFIFNSCLLKENGIIVMHREKKFKDKMPNSLTIIDERYYGKSKIIFGKNSL
tara:strand:- start:2671 stop:3240 length:570 start_codon:yes stop_codon:yes gene_type:complete